MSFPAQYPGTCDDCGARIAVGDQIEAAPAAPMGDVGHRYQHVSCPDSPEVGLRAGEEVCTTCFLVKPCPCEDGL